VGQLDTRLLPARSVQSELIPRPLNAVNVDVCQIAVDRDAMPPSIHLTTDCVGRSLGVRFTVDPTGVLPVSLGL
jgi:hypothetical protein